MKGQVMPMPAHRTLARPQRTHMKCAHLTVGGFGGAEVAILEAGPQTVAPERGFLAGADDERAESFGQSSNVLRHRFVLRTTWTVPHGAAQMTADGRAPRHQPGRSARYTRQVD